MSHISNRIGYGLNIFGRTTGKGVVAGAKFVGRGIKAGAVEFAAGLTGVKIVGPSTPMAVSNKRAKA